jgi:glycosyltransferase involved in cell wall biosynthesis
MPAIADRIVTIPIGVSIPSVKPHRVAAAGPLRIVYHGALKQHQKRVLDLPRIVEALAARHVPVQLTIAGGGPDEKELRERSQALVDRGLMEFSGVVAHEAIPALLDQHDVYLLASEFEGMPNALVEAMGRGLVPVVTRVASGSTELVRDGETGFLVPVGDIDAFAARLSLLHRDADLRLRLSDAAFDAVSGSYRVEDMVADYRELFAEVLHDVKTGRYRRERKELSHPPAQVAGVSLFPEPLPYHVPGVGRFPREQDYRAFRHRVRMAPAEAEVTWLPELRGAPSPAGALPEELTVIIGSPIWARNGVNLHSLKLVRGLTKRGIAARLLLTEEATDLVTVEEPRLDEPGDVAVDRLPVSRDQGWGAHWGATIRYLEEHAPCIYLPTYDWRHACVVPRLSPAIQVVGNLSSADPLSEEQAHRLGAYMSAIVTHDAETAALFQVAHPEPGGRLVVIPEGIEIPDEVPQALNRRPTGDILICASTLGGREAELVPILHGIGNRFDTARAILLGSADHPERRVPPVPEAVAGLALPLTWPAPKSVFGAHTVILSWLASDHVPTELVEAMGWGCIPFLIDCGGPSHTLFHHGENCYVFERGNAQAIADRMAELERSPRLRASMSASAHLSAHEWFTPFDTVLDQYVALFGRVVVASRTGGFVRPTGPMLPPPAAVNGISVFPVALDYEVADVGRFSSVQDHEAFSQQLAGAGGREAPPRSEDHDGEGER